ncbi:MAG: hypothetical protein S4CHLAM45_08730 [Chlamydiales bacterium]|nr:hypothetical protein [Chlamydiales bacterium]MCH9620377.1 hypothetical protein [Chlamydiales bacterium]MCH9622977.1 hypothetical protein [Chlamydiales bacterium]
MFRAAGQSTGKKELKKMAHIYGDSSKKIEELKAAYRRAYPEKSSSIPEMYERLQTVAKTIFPDDYVRANFVIGTLFRTKTQEGFPSCLDVYAFCLPLIEAEKKKVSDDQKIADAQKGILDDLFLALKQTLGESIEQSIRQYKEKRGEGFDQFFLKCRELVEAAQGKVASVQRMVRIGVEGEMQKIVDTFKDHPAFRDELLEMVRTRLSDFNASLA